ncbi:MAG: YncE family protein [Salinisphaera sp.]|jgi:YVTN family beta-propeller protein|nr:YncE family protein [Salinisphaera sp.]
MTKAHKRFFLIIILGCAMASFVASAAPPILAKIRDVPLPGHTTRFDYLNLDSANGLLYINHMDDGHVLVFDTHTDTVVANLPGFHLNTGLLAVPSRHRVYVSEAAANRLAVLDTRTRQVIARIPTGQFPDGIAYDPAERRIFVSDEHGGNVTVVDAANNRRIGTLDLGGETGNVRYDAVSGELYVTVQTRDELVAIDPAKNTITARHKLPGCDYPHGLLIAASVRQAFVACAGNARLLSVDLQTFTAKDAGSLGRDPDVLAFDPGLSRLYVASESGGVSVFKVQNGQLKKLGDLSIAPSAHAITVDPRTHRVYLPLKDIDGRPVLRIMAPSTP